MMDSFICEQCGKGFTQKTNLTRHKKVHLNGKFTCNRCFEHFGSEKSLEEHANKVHSTIVNQPNKFFCETCRKEFVARRSLVRHQEVNIEKEIKCKESEFTASFKTTRNLQDQFANTQCIEGKHILVTSVRMIVNICIHCLNHC